MNEIITLGAVSKLISGFPDFPEKVNVMVKSMKSADFERNQLISYVHDNPVFYSVFKKLNPADIEMDISETSALERIIGRLDTNSLRNILFACSILSLNKNTVSSMMIKKTLMSSYICKDLIEKVNMFRKSGHNPDNFFLYCLFHDIGEIFASVCMPEKVSELIFSDPDCVHIHRIDELLAHNEIGYMLARRWKMPSILSYICLNHNKLEYRKFTSEFIYIINAIAVSDAIAFDILGLDIPYSNTWDVGHSIYKIGLRESDIYTESGLIGSAEKKVSKIMDLFGLS